VFEKRLEALAEVIETRLAIGRYDETIFGALTIANEKQFTIAAVLRQGVPFILSELSLFFAGSKLGHRFFHDIADEIFWFDEMVAGI
jgi:hypothetical protein